MSEARPFDLNYGHLGEPIYDSENHEWQFPRVPRITRQVSPLGEPVIAHQASITISVGPSQSAAERLKNVKALTHEYPELFPSSHILPRLVQTSEAVNKITSVHDPTVSELLAFGQACDANSRNYGKTVPIIAIAGGEAGESLRLILLAQEQLGWTGSKSVYLNNLSSKGGEQARWSGNGSPIQQLVFAESEDQSSSWLAVRYQGAVSILKPQLRRSDYQWKSELTGAYRSRIDPNHIVTLSTQLHFRTQFIDVAFNPWHNERIATVDQEGHWIVWDIECLAPQRALWTIEKANGGSVFEDHQKDGAQITNLEDGWGAVLWAGNVNRLIVTSRRQFTVVDIKDGLRRLSVPNLVSRKSGDWILDVKRSCSVKSDAFITTSHNIHMLRIPAFDDANDDGVQCLLSWRHFRDFEDISLRLNLLTCAEVSDRMHGAAASTVLLYSRSSGVTTLFTVQHPTSTTDRAISTSDPRLLSTFKEQRDHAFTVPCVHHDVWRTRILALALRVVPFGFYNVGAPSGLGQLYVENNAAFYQLTTIYNDLSLSEQLYCDRVAGLNMEIHPPDTRIRKEVVKTTAKVSNDFIVLDGIEDDYFQNGTKEVSSHPPEEEALSSFQDHRTMSLEWLAQGLYAIGSLDNEGLHNILEHLYSLIEHQGIESLSHMGTLLSPANTKVSVADLDKASLDFRAFIQDVNRLQLDEGNMELIEAKPTFIMDLTTPPIQSGLALEGDIQISKVYDSLVQTSISSLSLEIPGRVRVALDKTLRDLAGQLCLSLHALIFDSDNADEGSHRVIPASGVGRQFSLPDRRAVPADNVVRGKEPAARSSSPLASSQISEDVGFLPSFPLGALPTPEPTPSLHSRSSVVSTTVYEDEASLYLKAFTKYKQPPELPTKALNLLSEWGGVADPADYDWEATQQAFANDDEPDSMERVRQWEKAQKRQKRQRQPTVGSSSQPLETRFGGSQPQQMTEDTQGSSQATPGIATASQVEPGRHGSRTSHMKKKRPFAMRPAGFK